jgi:hypothetical protein
MLPACQTLRHPPVARTLRTSKPDAVRTSGANGEGPNRGLAARRLQGCWRTLAPVPAPYLLIFPSFALYCTTTAHDKAQIRSGTATAKARPETFAIAFATRRRRGVGGSLRTMARSVVFEDVEERASRKRRELRREGGMADSLSTEQRVFKCPYPCHCQTSREIGAVHL